MMYIHNGILFSHKKKEILQFATTWMILEVIMLCEISQTEKDNTAQYNLYVESQKKKKEVLLIETESRMMAARDWEVGK